VDVSQCVNVKAYLTGKSDGTKKGGGGGKENKKKDVISAT
jgi:hypothetical protein